MPSNKGKHSQLFPLQVELFRELQMLSTDYLRQRALYSLQDLVTRFLTEEAVANEAKAAINEVS